MADKSNPAAFRPGNAVAVKHGAHNASLPARAVRAKVAAVEASLAAAVPVRGADGGAHPADAFAVARLAEVLCRIDLATAYLDEQGMVNAKGEGHSLLRHIARWESQAREWMNDLGLTPRSRVALGLGIAQTHSLAKQWARGADVIDAGEPS